MTFTNTQVSDFAEQVRGVTYSKGEASSNPKDGCLPILRANNITENGLTFDNVVYVPEKKISAKQRLKKGDIVVAASSGSLEVVGKAAEFTNGFEGSFGAFCKVVRPSGEIYPPYLAHFFKTDKYRKTISALAAGANINNLRNEHISSLELPLPFKNGKPDLDEQKRIAAILDKADAIRRKRRQALQLTDDFLRSLFLEMFGDPVTNPMGWPTCKIGDLMESVNYGSSRKASSNGQFPMIRMGNITYQGGWNFRDLKYIDLDEKEQAKHLVYKGQILFNRTNSKELVGKTAVFHEDEPMAFAGYLVRGITNDQANPEYISAYMNSKHGKATLQGMCKNIVGMANINAKEFQGISILKPPVTLQDKFANVVNEVREKANRINQFTVVSNDLFASLQQRAFKGAL